MPVRIRLARFGRKNLPFYRIFVADSRSPRDGRHLEVVGHFDPVPGAQPQPAHGLRAASAAPRRAAPFSRAHASAHAAAKDGNKHVGLNFERIRFWLSVGAQPTERVARLLGQAGVLPPLPRVSRVAPPPPASAA
jgi:small subunit ribosomal protein S16